MTAKEEKHNGNPLLRLLLGIGLLLPAMIACLTTLLVPTVQTILNSLEDNKTFTLGAANFIGLENYTRMFADSVFTKAAGLTAELALVRIVAAGLIPLVLAFSINEFGRRWKTAVRLLTTVPIALFAPVSAALAWGPAFGRNGFLQRALQPLGVDTTLWLGNPQSAPTVLIFIESLAAAGIMCGVGVTIFLAALRGRGQAAPSGRQILGPLLISSLVGLLAVFALPLPSFEFQDLIFSGGPANSTLTLGGYAYRMGFIRMLIGAGSAASVLILFLTVPAGIAAVLLTVLGNIRLETVPPAKSSAIFTGDGKPRWRKILFTAAAVWAILNLLLLFLLGSPPVLEAVQGAVGLNLPRLGGTLRSGPSVFLDNLSSLESTFSLPGLWINTVLPPLVGILFLQLPIAYLGALGIGAVRPLGKRSEWILLPFAPWLLVTVFPLAFALFESYGNVEGLNRWTSLIPPIAMSVPMLVILTLFFKGQEPKWRAARSSGRSGAFWRELILPSLPLAGLLAAVALLADVQEFYWPLIAVSSESLSTVSVFLRRISAMYAQTPGLAATASVVLELPIFVFFFLLFGLFNLFYADRLAIVSGDPHP